MPGGELPQPPRTPKPGTGRPAPKPEPDPKPPVEPVEGE